MEDPEINVRVTQPRVQVNLSLLMSGDDTTAFRSVPVIDLVPRAISIQELSMFIFRWLDDQAR